MSGTDPGDSEYGRTSGAETTPEAAHVADEPPIQAQVAVGDQVLVPAVYVDGGDLVIVVRIDALGSEPVSHPRDRVIFADPERARLALALADARAAWRLDQTSTELADRLGNATTALDTYDDGATPTNSSR